MTGFWGKVGEDFESLYHGLIILKDVPSVK